MSLWVKICANTSLADALLAADAGADAVGFVLAPSPRRVTPEQVATITPHLPATLEKIGVFVEGSLDEIANVVERCALTGVQLHSNFGPEVPTALRERFGKDLRILRVVHFGTDAGSEVLTLAENPNLDGILVDSKTATAVGGTGIVFDWKSARETVFGTDGTDLKLIAAGGLKPGNVAEAIATLDPWGVDVASGVEQSPGCKDPAKVREFIRNARAAGRGVDRENH